jgi:hypothetical protein
MADRGQAIIDHPRADQVDKIQIGARPLVHAAVSRVGLTRGFAKSERVLHSPGAGADVFTDARDGVAAG